MSSLSPSPVDNVRWLLFKLLQGFAGGTFGTTATAKYLPGPVDSCWTLTAKMLRGFSDGSFTGTANLRYAPAPGDNLTNLTRKLLQGFADGKFATGTANASKKSFAPGDDLWQIYRKLLQGFADGSFTNSSDSPSRMPSPADKDWDLLYKLDAGFSQGVFSITSVPPCTPPNPAKNLIDVLNTMTTIDFNWGQDLGGPVTDHFIVKWGTVSGVYTDTDTASGATFNYTITGLTAGTTYFIAVQAVGTDGCLAANSSELSTATTSLSPATTDWSNRVVANGDPAPSDSVLLAYDTWYKALVTAGIDGKIISNVLLNAAPGLIKTNITPFFHTKGTDPWGAPSCVGANFGVNGLTTTVGGYLTTGVTPATDYPSNNDCGIGCYFYDNPGTSSGYMFGCDNAGPTNLLEAFYAGGAGYFFTMFFGGSDFLNWNPVTGVGSFGNCFNGWFSSQRTASNLWKVFASNSTNPHATVGTSTNAPGAATVGQDIYFKTINANGTPGAPLPNTMSFAIVTKGLTLAEDAALAAATQTLLETIGGGFR